MHTVVVQNEQQEPAAGADSDDAPESEADRGA